MLSLSTWSCVFVWYAQPSVTLFALWIWHLFFVQAWHATQSILVSVVVGLCWQLLTKLMAYLQFVVGVAAVQQVLSYSWHVSVCEVSVWNFRTTGLQENVAVRILRTRRWQNSFFIHFHVRWLIVAVHHSVTFVNVTHMLIKIFHIGRLQSVSTLITEVKFCWRMHICQYLHITLVLPHYYCHVTICPVPDVTLFHFQCLAFEVI